MWEGVGETGIDKVNIRTGHQQTEVGLHQYADTLSALPSGAALQTRKREREHLPSSALLNVCTGG